MSQIPPSVTISSLQAGFQAQFAAAAREKDEASQTGAATRQAKAASLAGETVGVEDEDTAVFADSEGTGSQGRSFEPDDPEAGSLPESPDFAPDPDGGDAHLDIQA
ncbi:MAG: hypothetical protein BroJett003_02910 [Planctomycetota bacterium]|nr:MAG: hypothetical protein BroJett003_02910 [Planctomycetota bacterium]